MKMQAIQGSVPAIGPYSPALMTSGHLFISGQLPIDPETGRLSDAPIGDACRLVMRSIGALLSKAGLGFADVVKTTIFLTDLGDFSEVNAAYREFFSEPYPARSTIQVTALPMGSRIEIEAIAER